MSNFVLVSRETMHGRIENILGAYSNWKEAYRACKSLIGKTPFTGGLFLYDNADLLEDLIVSGPVEWKERKLYYNDFHEIYMQRTQ
jgi:hypothetical protein